jgi:hypothetical protein
MSEPTFDSDGYPTEETLQTIREWPPTDGRGLLEYVERTWCYPDFAMIDEGAGSRGRSRLGFLTGGWSGNESLVSAMEQNIAWWGMNWYSSVRGGHHTFEVKT